MRRFVSPLLPLLLSSTIAAQLGVTGVSPARNAVAVATGTAIEMVFNVAVDAASVTDRSFQVFGRWSGPSTGTLSVSGNTVRFVPDKPFFPGETVTVAASSAVRAQAGGNLLRGHAFQFWTKPAAGSGNFVQVAVLNTRRGGEGRIQSSGAYAGDLDGDGAPDLSIPNEIANDVRVMRNDGCGVFSLPVVHPIPQNSTPSPIEGADFNLDGVIDVAVSNIVGDTVSILLGNGQGGYLPHTTYPTGQEPRGLAVLDVDADGDTDVVTANHTDSNVAILLNNGNGTFTPPSFMEGGGSGERSIAAADANNDGVLDLFVGTYSSQRITVLLGDGAGSFTAAGFASAGGSPWMIAAGDVNGDGNVDIATANFNNNTTGVVLGDGTGGVAAAVTYTAGSRPLAVDLGDLEGDGDLDLVISNFSGSSFMAWRNDGSGNFGQRVTYPSPRAGSCALVVDYDRDGDMDIIGIDELDDKVLLFEQQGPAPSGVQPPTCNGTLRVANLGNRGGYGAAAPHPIHAGGRLYLGVSGPATGLHAIYASARLEPGLATGFGLLNLDPNFLLPLLTGFNDGDGEACYALAVPGNLPLGSTVCLQALVAVPALTSATLTNPERLRVE